MVIAFILNLSGEIGGMIIREICARAILSKSKIYEYTINPYAGCQHACSYCYARFMKKFSGHPEAWGGYVDVKINAADLLRKEIIRKKPGRVWISGVCDPYQPLEKKYELTCKCLEILIRDDWPVTLQTRSPLIVRDLELLKMSVKIEAGFSIPTADDNIRRLFEPGAPSIELRLKALGQLHEAGIRTFAMIAPALAGAEELVKLLPGKVDRVIIDKMNYHYADWVYRKHGLDSYLSTDYFSSVAQTLCKGLKTEGIDCQAFC
jgi:DNA repair photolyase